MKNDNLKITVKGVTEWGEKFETPCEFTLIRPKEGESYYGTGCYMLVKMRNDKQYVDTRYSGTKDIKKLAMNWIESCFGTNAKEVVEG